MAKVLVTKSKLDSLAKKINAKAGKSGKLTIAQMEETVDGISGTPKAVEWHQCPELPRKFVAEVTYNPSDYSVSKIASYAPATAVVSNYKPIGTTVDETTFYNEEPNAKTPFVLEKTCGTLTPLDKVRYINTPGAPNVRDLGGWACDGGTVKYGLLFRGGEPTASDRAVLVDELGVRHDLNLRGASEAAWNVSPLGDDIYFTRADEYNWYALTNTEAWRINLRCVFDAVTRNEPVLFHCAAGADRTGTLACILEGLLGMSQSDIDKDYELTCFYSGTSTDSQARRRNEAEWKGLITAINAKSGSTFRDKCVTFAAELGFTADEINAYRAAMIDGTPATVTPSISTFTVSKSLGTGATSDNSATKATQYQPYEANIACKTGYIIESIKVTMGGTDITSQVWSGKKANLRRSVTYYGGYFTKNNDAVGVIDGQGYGAMLTAKSGYAISNIKISMDGVDITDKAWLGKEKSSGSSGGSSGGGTATTKYTVSVAKASNCTMVAPSTVSAGAPLNVTVTPLAGYAISRITVTMGGTDITSTAVTLT